VLVPFNQLRYPNVQGADAEHGNAEQQVRFQLQRGLVGLSGESRLSDGNNQWFHTSIAPPATHVQPAPPTVVDQPPPRRPDVPCETQELPNLAAPSARVTAFGGSLTDLVPKPLGDAFDTEALRRVEELLKEHQGRLGR
jgi:hypothetical protein